MRVDEYTPGPWFIWNARGEATRVGPSSNCTVASIYHPPIGCHQANARLIAAAPDLLRALEKIMCTLGEQVHMHGGDGLDDEAWAAIAKAIGRESMP